MLFLCKITINFLDFLENIGWLRKPPDEECAKSRRRAPAACAGASINLRCRPPTQQVVYTWAMVVRKVFFVCFFFVCFSHILKKWCFLKGCFFCQNLKIGNFFFVFFLINLKIAVFCLGFLKEYSEIGVFLLVFFFGFFFSCVF